MKNKSIGNHFMRGGLLLIAAALCLIGMNLWEETRAASAAAGALDELRTVIPHPSPDTPETESQPDLMPEPEDASPETEAVSPPSEEVLQPPAIALPAWQRDPDREMPVRDIQGQAYIGILDIPSLEISLPVIGEWSYPSLKIAPCRFSGSVYLDDLIILGHNYRRHLGALPDIAIGDTVLFTDMEGNVFTYEASAMETLDGDDVEGMEAAGDWDLTIFTCTMSGQTRVTVRCVRTDPPKA